MFSNLANHTVSIILVVRISFLLFKLSKPSVAVIVIIVLAILVTTHFCFATIHQHHIGSGQVKLLLIVMMKKKKRMKKWWEKSELLRAQRHQSPTRRHLETIFQCDIAKMKSMTWILGKMTSGDLRGCLVHEIN